MLVDDFVRINKYEGKMTQGWYMSELHSLITTMSNVFFLMNQLIISKYYRNNTSDSGLNDNKMATDN